METTRVSRSSEYCYESLIELAQRYGRDNVCIVECTDGLYGGVINGENQHGVEFKSPYRVESMESIESPLLVIGDHRYELSDEVAIPEQTEWILVIDGTQYRLVEDRQDIDLPRQVRGSVYTTQWRHKTTHTVVLTEENELGCLGTCSALDEDAILTDDGVYSATHVLELIQDGVVTPPRVENQPNPTTNQYPHFDSPEVDYGHTDNESG